MTRLQYASLRTLVRMCGFAALIALFGCVATVAVGGRPTGTISAQDTPQDEPKTPEQEEEARIEETFKTALGDEGVLPVKPPSKVLRVVILRVPQDGHWNDDPLDGLSTDARKQALAFESVLEQQIDYRPWLHRFDSPRVKRHYARLRSVNLTSLAGFTSSGAHGALEAAAVCFGADLVLSLAYGSDSRGLSCIVHMFARDKGMKGNYNANLNEFGSEKNPENAAKQYPIHAQTILSVLAGHAIAKEEEEALPVVPLLAANDAALGHFVAMRQCFEKGDLDGAWIEYAACLKADPKCGRAALFGMEIFRNHPSQLSPNRAVQEGIKGARATPNDVLLRGRLAYNAAIWFKKKDWALAALETALKAQPHRFELLAWKALVITENDQQKMKAWLIEHALPVCKDGRCEVAIGNCEAISDRLGDAIEWYEKAIKIAPNDHEANFSLAIISTHHAERLQRTAFIDSTGDEQRERAVAHFNRAVWAWNRCLEIDPTEHDMVLEFYVRAATRDYKYLPADDAGFNRLFLIQSVRNGLVKGAGGNNFSRLVGPMLETQQPLMREWVKSAKPEDADYELKLVARINFASIDKTPAEAVFALRELRRRGYRGPGYAGNIERYAAEIAEADARAKK